MFQVKTLQIGKKKKKHKSNPFGSPSDLHDSFLNPTVAKGKPSHLSVSSQFTKSGGAG